MASKHLGKGVTGVQLETAPTLDASHAEQGVDPLKPRHATVTLTQAAAQEHSFTAWQAVKAFRVATAWCM